MKITFTHKGEDTKYYALKITEATTTSKGVVNNNLVGKIMSSTTNTSLATPFNEKQVASCRNYYSMPENQKISQIVLDSVE